MKDLNWEQGLVRVYYVLWFLGAAFSVYPAFTDFDQRNKVLWVVLAVIAPAVLLKLLRWGIPWLIQGFVKKT